MEANTPKEIFGPEFSKVDFLRISGLKIFGWFFNVQVDYRLWSNF
jgi:hypothetical protein